MEVTIDRYRVLHLIVLMFTSYIIAKILILKWDWSSMSAYGFGVTISTQISNAMHTINNDKSNAMAIDQKREEKRERVEKRRERRNEQSKASGRCKK